MSPKGDFLFIILIIMLDYFPTRLQQLLFPKAELKNCEKSAHFSGPKSVKNIAKEVFFLV